MLLWEIDRPGLQFRLFRNLTHHLFPASSPSACIVFLQFTESSRSMNPTALLIVIDIPDESRVKVKCATMHFEITALFLDSIEG